MDGHSEKHAYLGLFSGLGELSPLLRCDRNKSIKDGRSAVVKLFMACLSEIEKIYLLDLWLHQNAEYSLESISRAQIAV